MEEDERDERLPDLFFKKSSLSTKETLSQIEPKKVKKKSKSNINIKSNNNKKMNKNRRHILTNFNLLNFLLSKITPLCPHCEKVSAFKSVQIIGNLACFSFQ